jgi:hypothetical protein
MGYAMALLLLMVMRGGLDDDGKLEDWLQAILT